MDAHQKKLYNKAKCSVKRWEREFKLASGCNPTKADIKEAPTKIKDSYKLYYKLKTLMLETTLCDIEIDENAKDCFNSSSETANDKNSHSLSGEGEESLIFKPLEDTNLPSESSLLSPLTPDVTKNSSTPAPIRNEPVLTSFKDVTFEKNNINETEPIVENPDLKNVWGSHLSKNQPKVDLKKLKAKSISFQYTEKLFQGSKFNKRNPRKPRNFSKNKSMDSFLLDSSALNSSLNESNVEENKPAVSFAPKAIDVSPLNSPDSLSNLPSLSISELNIDQSCSDSLEPSLSFIESDLPLLDTTVKFVKKNITTGNRPAINFLQDKLCDDGPNKLSSSMKINEGWLDRVSDSLGKKIEINSSDSGIDTQETKCGSPDSNNETDEDFICDSDSESQSQSLLKLNLIGRSFSQSKISEPSVSTVSTPTEVKNTSSYPSVFNSSLFDKDTQQGPSTSSQSSEPSFSNKRNVSLLDDVSSPLPKKQKNEITEAVMKAVSFLPKPSLKPDKRSKARDALEKKKELFEKKVLSGAANENFVRINIEKKVYVRGRKRFNHNTYKKQQWKNLKKEMRDFASKNVGIVKCFKCGDVGHTSKGCIKGEASLLPLEEYDSSEESPFPTLEEAEEKSKEASNIYSKPKAATTENIECTQPEEEEPAKLGNIIKPYYDLKEDGGVIDTPKEVYRSLYDFGHEDFRHGQEEAVMRILSGLSTLLTLSTGSGKSLCYQLPAYMYYKKFGSITLVVSPLVSLMEDQVHCVSGCLPIASLHTNLTEKKRNVLLEKLKEGALGVLLLSPETLVSWESSFAGSILKHLPPISFACVDEAHCVSHWSHNFRPSYLTVCQVLKERLGVRTILGLTATASKTTLNFIQTQLGAIGPGSVISDTPLPDNLLLSVSSEVDRKEALVRLLTSPRFSSCQSIIIYCTRREQCDNLAAFLRASFQDGSASKRGRLSSQAEVYHAGLTAGKRNSVQNAFMSGKLKIVVATIAFGMGINKNDIRGIIHYNMPSSFESYVQEVGRAGRDRKIAHCHLFLDNKGEDLCELRRHIYCNSVERHILRKLLELVFVKCDCKECPKHEVAFSIEDTVKLLDLPHENICTLLSYLQLDQDGWVEALNPVYMTCRVSSYKGAKHLQKIAKECAPLAVAILESGEPLGKNSFVEFDIIKLARKINWWSGTLKRVIKNLEWTKNDDNWARSGITVDLSGLGFHLKARGNLTEKELDDALDSLYKSVYRQEHNGLAALQIFYHTLKGVAHRSVAECSEEVDMKRSDQIKTQIREFFTTDQDLESVVLDKVELKNETQIAIDIRQLIVNHREDHSLTGRAIARILHGIGSPNFPPLVWARTRFWRLYLKEDFNLLCRLATKQLILMR